MSIITDVVPPLWGFLTSKSHQIKSIFFELKKSFFSECLQNQSVCCLFFFFSQHGCISRPTIQLYALGPSDNSPLSLSTSLKFLDEMKMFYYYKTKSCCPCDFAYIVLQCDTPFIGKNVIITVVISNIAYVHSFCSF